MSGKKSFALTGSTVMLWAGALALAAAIYWVVFLGRGAEAPVSALDAEPQETVEVEGEPATETGEQVAVQEEPEVVAEPEVAAGPEPEPVPEVVAEAEEEAASEDDAAAEVEAEAEADAGEAADSDADAEDTVPEVAQAPVGPGFDLVRIDPQGAAVIAGTAAPGAVVILLADGVEVGRATADSTGKFVALFDMPPSDAPRSLSAQMLVEGAEAVASAGTVLIAPVRPVELAQVAPEVAAEAEPEAEAEAAEAPEENTEENTELAEVADGEGDTSASTDIELAEADTPDAEAPEAEAPDAEAPDAEIASGEDPADAPAAAAPEAPAIVLADDSGITVLQGAEQPAVPSQSPQVSANLVIDTITYDDSGDVALAGRGQGAGFARVYLDDRPVQTVQIAPDGTWRTPLPDVDAGVYRLRIDELDADGTVTSRVETPFQREEPEVVAEAAGRPNVVTVQEGFTLWAIAEDRFGSGVEYVRVYEANRDLIRDPDLIYPGQVFAIPEG